RAGKERQGRETGEHGEPPLSCPGGRGRGSRYVTCDVARRPEPDPVRGGTAVPRGLPGRVVVQGLPPPPAPAGRSRRCKETSRARHAAGARTFPWRAPTIVLLRVGQALRWAQPNLRAVITGPDC